MEEEEKEEEEDEDEMEEDKEEKCLACLRSAHFQDLRHHPDLFFFSQALIPADVWWGCSGRGGHIYMCVTGPIVSGYSWPFHKTKTAEPGTRIPEAACAQKTANYVRRQA